MQKREEIDEKCWACGRKKEEHIEDYYAESLRDSGKKGTGNLDKHITEIVGQWPSNTNSE
tara:strand:+ start:556 stop:735 length:180 start_codon:yes stop_codon:yes gene_type:complete